MMKFNKIALSVAALIFISGVYCFSQSNETGRIMKPATGQEVRIAALEKRIAESADEFISKYFTPKLSGRSFLLLLKSK